MKTYIVYFCWGILIAMVSLLIPYQYCMDGPGRGLPFAVYSPNCGAWWVIHVLDDSKIPQILDLGGFAADVLFWIGVVVLTRYFLRRRAR